MKLTRAFASVALLLGAGVAPAAAHAAGGGHGWTLRVEGASGTSYWVDVTARTELANAGGVSRLVAGTGWSGVALVRPSANPSAAGVYVALDLPAALRCPGGQCPWTAPPPDMTSDPEGFLTPGRYRLVLLGPPGTRVSASLGSALGRVRWAPHRAAGPVRLSTATTEGQGVAGHEAVLHTFHAMPGGHGFNVVWSVQYYAVAPAGVVETTPCITDGPTDTTIASAGGVAPCADFQGFDFLGGTSVGTTYYAPAPTGYAPVSAAAAGSYGREDGRPVGVGWDAMTVAPGSYLGNVFVGFSLPM
jgi:hypothetical protein